MATADVVLGTTGWRAAERLRDLVDGTLAVLREGDEGQATSPVRLFPIAYGEGADLGDALESALAHIDRRDAERELGELGREIARADPAHRPALERAEAAVRSQLASAERIEQVAGGARTRLRVLNAQMDEAVARAVELSVTGSDAADLRPLSADVDSLVTELEALRLAMDETSGAAPGAGA